MVLAQVMNLIEAALTIVTRLQAEHELVPAAIRYLKEALDRGDNPWPQPHQEAYTFGVTDPDPPPHAPIPPAQMVTPPDTPQDPKNVILSTEFTPELWAVVKLADGSYGLWHPQEQSVLFKPFDGFPKHIAEARKEALNRELLETVYGKPTPPPSTQEDFEGAPRPLDAPAKGLVHYYADQAEAQRLAAESQEQFKPRK